MREKIKVNCNLRQIYQLVSIVVKANPQTSAVWSGRARSASYGEEWRGYVENALIPADSYFEGNVVFLLKNKGLFGRVLCQDNFYKGQGRVLIFTRSAITDYKMNLHSRFPVVLAC